jgi:hypothetical protein
MNLFRDAVDVSEPTLGIAVLSSHLSLLVGIWERNTFLD